MTTDRFGNRIDPDVGYARGQLLRSSADEIRRLRNAQLLAANYVAKNGPQSIGIFTGNSRYCSLAEEDLSTYCEEWVGPGLFSDELKAAATEHLGGNGSESIAVFNRTSAGIIAAILALTNNKPVISLVPVGDRSHASVIRGCNLAAVELIEVTTLEELATATVRYHPSLIVITTVTSALARLDDDISEHASSVAKSSGATVLLDEAYGARFRPILHGGCKSLQLGANLAITNTDKAGLSGPRAGVMAGDSKVLINVAAKASELGMEARAPIAAGALRSLQNFDPQMLIDEVADAQTISDKLTDQFGDARVQRSELGPMIDEQDILVLVLEKSGQGQTSIVPAEASAAIAMIMLRDNGVLTVNTHGQPGGRVSVRLKPTPGALTQIGGVDTLLEAFNSALDELVANLHNVNWFKTVLFGEQG